MALTIGHISYALVLLLAVLLAYIRGGAHEKLAATAFLVSSIVTPLISPAPGMTSYMGIAMIDLAVLAVLVYISLETRSYWPLFSAGFHLNTLGLHLLVASGLVEFALGYRNGLVFWSYAVLAPLVVHTLSQGDREAQ
jgi:hypothetical protein